ncbi:hypothetical protein KW800_01220 [Candidatus Parcubacteria bacterium]|nr:hypothetical protein [Candidatus Parcubacteria bacterium]
MATVFFVFISTTVILGLGSMISSSQRLISKSIHSEQAYYIAEAGAEETAYALMHGLPADTPTIESQSPVVAVAPEGENMRISSTATIDDVERTVEILLYASSTDSRILSWKESR